MNVDAKGIIQEKAKGELLSFALSRGKSRAHESVKRVIEQTSHEYGNRFLLELIQNAYDAHPPSSTHGRIVISLRHTEEDHGVLYVANAGEPFNRANFEAICDIGLSSKQPGEAIGNKGLGFRSVFQICRWPEIFSASEANTASPAFNGFCFGFAQNDDIRRICQESLSEQEGLAEQAIGSLSPYTLPVPLSTQSEATARFAAEAFSTVIRLPLSSALALRTVEEQIASLRSSESPVLLFLDRVESLILETVDDAGEHRVVASRERRPLPESLRLDGFTAEIADMGTQGVFVVASLPINHRELMQAIDESIREDRLPSAWADWRGDAAVSIAVRVDRELENATLYNFLPMGGDAKSPLNGFLNAPFYAKNDRTNIHEDVPLNAFLLECGADLSVRFLLALGHNQEPFLKNAIVDLLTWTSHTQLFSDAFGRLGEDLQTIRCIPIERTPTRLTAGSLKTVYRWADDYDYIKAQRLVRYAQAELVDKEITKARTDRLQEFCSKVIGAGLDPSQETLAEWAEKLAVCLHKGAWKASQWDLFYGDVARLFKDDGSSLLGKRILLGDDGRLHPCGEVAAAGKARRTRLVFFPPRQTRTEGEEEVDPSVDIRIPASLHTGLCFMHPDLTWYSTERRTTRRKPARTFLEEQRLVRRYDSRELLSHLADLLARTKSNKIWSDAIRWSHSLYRASTTYRLQLDQLKFRVPTTAGWLPAGEAFFSSAWPVDLASDLAKLIRETRAESPQLAEIDSKLILAPNAWPFPLADISSWMSFLRAIGVRDGLWPLSLGKSGLEWQGLRFQHSNLHSFPIQAPNQKEWIDDIRSNSQSAQHPYTDYRIKGSFFRLPGQADYQSLSTSARLIYARLLIAGLNQWPDNALVTEISRPYHPSKPDALHWPTPAATFLRNSPWVPMKRPGQREEIDFHTPHTSWHVESTNEDPIPLYAPLVPVEFRRLLDRSDRSLARLRSMGIKLWGAVENSTDLVQHLGDLLSGSELPETQIEGFRKAYRRAWGEALEQQRSGRTLQISGWHCLVVSRSHRVETVDLAGTPANQTEGVYFRDTSDELVTDLLESVGQSVFDIGPELGAAAFTLLSPILGSRARLASEVEPSVLVDGQLIDRATILDPLVQQGLEWLEVLVCLALEFGTTFATQRSERTRAAALQRLRSVRLRRATSLSIEIEGLSTSLPEHLRALRFDVDQGPAIVVVDPIPGPQLSWEGLTMIAGSLSQIVGHSGIANLLELAILKLSSNGRGPFEATPSDTDWAIAFGKSEESIRQIRQSMRGSTAVAIEFLVPILCHFIGLETATTFAADATEYTHEDVVGFLERHHESLPVAPSALLEACHNAEDLNSLLDKLGIDYADINRALSELGLKLMHNSEGHAHAFKYFKHENRERILGCLREAFLGSFLAGKDIHRYVAARDGLDQLGPDPAWLDVCFVPSAQVMTERVDGWLKSAGAHPIAQHKGSLQPLEEVRRDNSALVVASVERLVSVVRAWCEKNSNASDPIWSEANLEVRIEQLAERDGLYDFVPLSLADIVEWLGRCGIWPVGMPSTADLAALSLTTDDLDKGAREAAEKTKQAEFERRSIELHGQRVSAGSDNWKAIAQAVRTSLTSDFLSTPARLTRLRELQPGAKHHGVHSGSTSGSGGSRNRLSDEQRNAIGLIGEIAALEWLKQAYPGVSDACWKSTYRDFIVGGTSGNDALGYDFEVLQPTYTLFFEVKSSTGHAMEIELAESEVECARRSAGERRQRFRILYVSNAAHPTDRRIHLLPNPFSERGRKVFRLRGAGMRYQFRLE